MPPNENDLQFEYERKNRMKSQNDVLFSSNVNMHEPMVTNRSFFGGNFAGNLFVPVSEAFDVVGDEEK